MRLMNYAIFPNLTFSDPFWVQLRQEAKALAEREGVMSKLLQQGVLQHATFNEALANRLALKLANDDIDATSLRNVVEQTLQRAPDIVDAALADMRAVYERDPACHSTIQIFFSSRDSSHCKPIVSHMRCISTSTVKWPITSKAGYQNSSVSISIRPPSWAKASCSTMLTRLSSVKRRRWATTSPCCIR